MTNFVLCRAQICPHFCTVKKSMANLITINNMNMKVTRTILPVFLALVFALFSSAALQGQGFIKTYSPATAGCRDLVETPDGGFFMAGEIASTDQMFLQKVDHNGNVVWTNHLSLNGARARAACLSGEGDFIVLAENYPDAGVKKNIVLRLDPNGGVLWQTVVDNSFLSNGLRDIIKTSDGNFLAAGDTRNAALNQDIRLVKMDPNGGILWSQTFGNPAVNEQVSRLIELPGGDIAISGAGLNGADHDLFLAKTNAAGNLVWQNWYVKPARQKACDLLRMSDGGLMLLGDTYGANPTQISLLKTDADGNELWFQQIFPWPGQAVNPLYTINSFARDIADNLYIAGYTSVSFGISEAIFLMKVDAIGTLVWKSTLSDTTPLDIPWQIINTSDNKFAIGGGWELNSGAFLIKTNTAGEIYTNKIAGSVYYDASDNCLPDSGEPPLTNFIVKAENQFGETFFKNITATGSFLMPVSEGDFMLSVVPVYGMQNFWLPCNTQAVAVSGTYQIVQAPPLGLRSEVDCPQMYVEVAAPFLRRCAVNNFNVVYCNNGNATATDASVQLTLSSPLLSYENSTIPLSSQNGNVLTFDLPDVTPGQCGSFNVSLILDCEAELGDIYCVEAHIFPDSICPSANSLWDGSHLEVEGACTGDVVFKVTNTGAGNMTGAVDYVIVEDQIMYMQGGLQLDTGEDTLIVLSNPSGGPYFLQTSQRPGHPGVSVPSSVVSPCGGAAASSALQFPENDAEPFLSEYCGEVIGSFDPNDKQGFPMGWKDAHFIERGQELEYRIRFQNTGTDTAFLVVIRDTLTSMLDAATVRPGPSSHPYTFDLSSTGELTFRFDNILLADSAANEPASHGFVSFHIAQKPDLPLGTVIENKAAIYFDYNDPVITNTTFHTIGKPFTSFVKDPPAGGIGLEIFPNPFTEEAGFHLTGLPPNAQVTLTVFNAQGIPVRTESFAGADYQFRRNNLPQGVYYFRLESEGKTAASGRLITFK